MQTFNNPLKTKDVQVTGPIQENQQVMTTQWGIYDAYNGGINGETEEV